MCARVPGCVYTEVGACLCESMNMRVCVHKQHLCACRCVRSLTCVYLYCVYTCVYTCNICAHICVCLGKDIYMWAGCMYVCCVCMCICFATRDQYPIPNLVKWFPGKIVQAKLNRKQAKLNRKQTIALSVSFGTEIQREHTIGGSKK